MGAGEAQTSSHMAYTRTAPLCEEGSCRVCAQSPVKHLVLHKSLQHHLSWHAGQPGPGVNRDAFSL